MRKKHLLCIGRVCLDISAIVNEMPEGDTKVFAEQSIYQIGGNAVNAALCAAKLGGETIRVHVHAAVGDEAPRIVVLRIASMSMIDGRSRT